MDPLFPELPEDLQSLSDEEVANLLREHEVAADLIMAEDEEFTKGLSADEVLAELERGVEQIETIRAEQGARVKAEEEYQVKKAELGARREAVLSVEEEAKEEEPVPDPEPEPEPSDPEPEEAAEVKVETLSKEEEPEEVTPESTPPLAADSAVRPLRRPPAPSAERAPVAAGTPLLAAAGHQDVRSGTMLDRLSLARAYYNVAKRHGRPSKSHTGIEQKLLVASAQFQFPPERVLVSKDWEANAERIRAAVPQSVPGMYGNMAMVASGGLCAPLEPIYTMPNFASEARPVRDALPSFQADRGGVNVPEATYIGDITSAISTIEESEDAQGGTFATKSCQDLDCPAYTETAVTILSHCREYGNLIAMSWPEKVSHENDLTMAAHARTAESYLLDRIKAQSVNVTNGVETLGALIYLVDAIVKSSFGIRGRLRMSRDARFRALIPAWVPEMLVLDTVQTIDGNRFTSEGELVSYLRSLRIEPTFYLDTPSTGTTQLPDASQTAAAIDPLPDNVQWALFPEGGFIHLDGGSLELGIVRDSTLNSTNDFQIFGETFENVFRVAPAQSCYWVTSDLCANGQFPPAGTVRTCD